MIVSVRQICVLPAPNSPMSSVSACVSIPPPSSLSRFFEPVLHLSMPCLLFHNSSAVMKSIESVFLAAFTMLRIVLNPIPVFSAISFGGVTANISTVVIPAVRSLLAMAGPMPSTLSISFSILSVIPWVLLGCESILVLRTVLVSIECEVRDMSESKPRVRTHGSRTNHFVASWSMNREDGESVFRIISATFAVNTASGVKRWIWMRR